MKKKDPETLWREAETFEELCELNARFVEGEIEFSPTYGAGSLDDESKPLIPYLAALNRAGFLTTSSQPGEDRGHSKQRAFVDGLALKETALRIERLSMFSDLYIMTTEPGRFNGCMMPITIDEFRPHSWGGAASLDDENGIFTEVMNFQENCNERAMQHLSQAWEVCVIDLCWGRSEYLWNQLANELCVMLNPHKGWGTEDWPFPEK
jgi:hypothetical protein